MKQILHVEEWDEDALTKKERLTEHDDDEASIVPRVLARDNYFIGAARELAGMPLEERACEATRLAKACAPYRGPYRGRHQELITGLLLHAAKEFQAGHSRALVEFRLVNHSRRAVWGEAGLEELDPRRKRERWTTLEQGAKRLARRLAGRCIELSCPTKKLARDQLNGRGWPKHCSAHQRLPQAIRQSQINEIREALDAATGQRRFRRAARRRP